MKNILAIVICFTISSCGISNTTSGLNYRIVKIDSIKNVNVIYAERTNVSIQNTAIIKIASTKTKNRCKNNRMLILNHNYKLNIQSLYPENFVSQHYLRGLSFNGVLIPFDKDYNVKKDLYTSENIKGLCYHK